MKFWNKETRRPEDGVYYRVKDWSVERKEDWSNPNFTTKTPPELSLSDSCPCDWSEKLGAWILDIVEADDIEAKRNLKTTDEGMDRVLEDLISLLVANEVISTEELPIKAQDKLIAREELRKKLK